MRHTNITIQNLGFLPRLNAHFGQRYTVAATEALSEFQRVQLNQRAARNQLERVVDLQAGKGQPWDLVDRFVSSKVTSKVIEYEEECIIAAKNIGGFFLFWKKDWTCI